MPLPRLPVVGRLSGLSPLVEFYLTKANFASEVPADGFGQTKPRHFLVAVGETPEWALVIDSNVDFQPDNANQSKSARPKITPQ